MTGRRLLSIAVGERDAGSNTLALLCVALTKMMLTFCRSHPGLSRSSQFATQEQTDAAMSAMNEQELDGRQIRVNYANSQGRGGGGGGGRGA